MSKTIDGRFIERSLRAQISRKLDEVAAEDN